MTSLDKTRLTDNLAFIFDKTVVTWYSVIMNRAGEALKRVKDNLKYVAAIGSAALGIGAATPLISAARAQKSAGLEALLPLEEQTATSVAEHKPVTFYNGEVAVSRTVYPLHRSNITKIVTTSIFETPVVAFRGNPADQSRQTNLANGKFAFGSIERGANGPNVTLYATNGKDAKIQITPVSLNQAPLEPVVIPGDACGEINYSAPQNPLTGETYKYSDGTSYSIGELTTKDVSVFYKDGHATEARTALPLPANTFCID
jgi:hypothetical protein